MSGHLQSSSNTKTTESFSHFFCFLDNNLRSILGVPRKFIAMPWDHHFKLLSLRRLSFLLYSAIVMRSPNLTKFGNSTGLTLVYVSGARLLDWGSSFPHKDGFNRACYFFKTFLTLFSSSAANVSLVIKKKYECMIVS